ncbi:DUF2254 domain-containing protein [Sphingomonas mucosissima]|uniref:DUF2254 domain-containing protein n=1 Tax=Sphingomonas mucosissima TaxID=370959 RepID=A0A245ZTF4_9SPHN|nr:DUF2254 domain-containing protein [Sphingomonas mucosissima]OWK33007.1 hypothetical protein SPMU_13510 [Sphingomonas mucosissima]
MGGAILNWLRAGWDAVRTSLWILPAIMFVAGIAMAVAALELSLGWAEGRRWAHWISSGSGDDARNLISTLLTAVVTMASLAFSVTVVALSLAANTFGSRLIRIFRSDRRTQIVLGMFVMTIVYLLLVLRTLRGEAPASGVPEVAVALGTLLALVSVLALLAFMQNVASLITAGEVVRRARREFDSAIGELPLAPDVDSPTAEATTDARPAGTKIRLPREGYVQSVEFTKILQWAERNDAVVRLNFRPGDFVVEGDHKVEVIPPPPDPERARKAIGRFIASGPHRTPTQDLEFAIRQLVEVAVRALSPGINDPFTAMAVIDRLRGGLARLATRRLPPATLEDSAGTTRLVRNVTTYAGAVDAAFNQIRQAGSAKPAILIHLLKALEDLGEHARTAEQREAFQRHALLAHSAARRDVAEPLDQRDVEIAYDRAVRALGANEGAEPAVSAVGGSS